VQINKISINNNQLSFKANYFRVDKLGRHCQFMTISTDNEENLGKEPVLQYERRGKLQDFPMVYDGKYYTTEVIVRPDKYRIFYKDTGKYERNGEYQIINPLYYTKIATQQYRKQNNLPLENSIAKGEVEGKVFVNTLDIPQDIPAILILDEINKAEDLVLKIPKNVKGVITSQTDIGILDHTANLVRNHYNVLSVVLDDDKFDDLKKQEGKNLYINNEHGLIKYKEIDDINTIETNPIQAVVPPKLENVERLLTYDELTPQNCGNKGYRISLIKKLIEEGKLKDISLPQGFVIPEGYINKLIEYIDVHDKKESKDRLNNGIYTQVVNKKVEELGMDKRNLIVRSNFNDEDLGSFSSAGIYESILNWDDEVLATTLDILSHAKESELPKYIHNKYGIENSQIQPSVIVQDRIKSNYDFTVYSDDNDNNTIIQLADSSTGFYKPNKALIKYNKNTKEMTIVNKESPKAKYIIDESGKIISEENEDDTITKNLEILTPFLEIVTSGAAVLEKFFNHPQDIEGGITKDGKVFFWQTRDIVAKGKKKI
jgi:hypothetical protein